MRPLQLIAILTTTVAVVCSLYAPQPIQRVLAAHFGVGLQTSALFITVALLPLSIAPLAYGLLLERIQARRMLMVSVLGLALATTALAFCDGLRPFLALRFAQGLLIPAA
ncbi:MFS transporter, partial [Desulfocurvibacter africanus]|uniref:MFS transporter n=1 Tax=Desulfocurvibacter africanus TaxID=873 RepID=UPI002FDB2A46